MGDNYYRGQRMGRPRRGRADENRNYNQRGGREGERGAQRGGRGEGRGAQRGRGRGGNAYDPDYRIGYRALETAANGTQTEALMFCNKPSFLNLLLNEERRDFIDLALKTIDKALQAEAMDAYREALGHQLLNEAISFLSQTCGNRYSNELSSSSQLSEGITSSLQSYLNVFHQLCAMDPLAIKTLIGPVRMLKLVLDGVVNLHSQLATVQSLYAQATRDVENREREENEAVQRRMVISRTGRVATTDRPSCSFRELSVYPTVQDMRIQVRLRKQVVEGSFDSIDDYLDIQFRLLREDFVSTIRNGIKGFKDRPYLTGANRFRSGDVKVYENFTVLSPNFGKSGVTYLIRIDRKNRMFARMNWFSTKRLMYGSLLCLSQDCFERMHLFAIISERKPEVIAKDGVFEIQFLPESQKMFDELGNEEMPFMAVESTAYFEAYYHVLTGMHYLNSNNFPLSQYIVRVQRQIELPVYLKGTFNGFHLILGNGNVSESVAASELVSNTAPHRHYSYGYNHGYGYEGYGYDTSKPLPTAAELGFNKAQHEAFKMALTKEFVIIQGPPGTGKTYVGLKIVEALLYNFYGVPCGEPTEETEEATVKMHSLASSTDFEGRRRDMCPTQTLQQMLVVCFTNHALDQFLEGMLDFCPISDMVRVGSRSNNARLEPCNISKQRGRRSRQLFHAHLDLKAKKERFVTENDLEQLMKWMELSKVGILNHNTAGLFSNQDRFYTQICDYAKKLPKTQSDHNDHSDVLAKWLHCDAVTFSASLRAEQFDGTRGSDEKTEDENCEDDSIKVESIDIIGEAERELENRMQDDENVNDDFLKLVREKLAAGSTVNLAEPEFERILNKKEKLKYKLYIEKNLSDKNIMEEEEIDTLNRWIDLKSYDITVDLELQHRWRLYRYLVRQFQREIKSRFRKLQETYTHIIKLGEDLRKQEDIETLRKAKVIGMTTTGAARMQRVLQQVGPEIVVVEEAAEVLEAHIITALSKDCKHLILIGDHKQLKPNPTVYELAKSYHLDLSLFERMVKNGLPIKTLNIQHRMRPEVSKYIKGSIYDDLQDHNSVLSREHIEGVDKSVFFFNHNQLESSDDQIMSHSNKFEADMVVGFTRYLLRQQSYEPRDITIITMYTGQLLMIKKSMPKAEFEGVKITSVDNFQGEENKIVIVSLVRSNDKGKLGFIEIENRVCVALSRAKFGMYVFGNFDMLSKGSKLWQKIVFEAKSAEEFGSSLRLSCRRHRNPCVIEKAEDFVSKAPAGGCMRTCDRSLDCGHKCRMRCHSRDLKHELYKCPNPCSKTYPNCGHKCTRLCHEVCPKCSEQVQGKLPCGHKQFFSCYMLYEPEIQIPCLEVCPNNLPTCGHPCKEKCSQPCTVYCTEMVERLCSHCQELKSIECAVASHNIQSYSGDGLQYSYQCDTPCHFQLSCGHQCTGTCYSCRTEGHKVCLQPCKKRKECGHECAKTCHDCSVNGKCAECKERCPFRCRHDEPCKALCGDPCSYHKDKKKCGWGCEHSRCSKMCEEACDHVPCSERCTKYLECRQKNCNQMYQCAALCGEKCIKFCPHCDLHKKKSAFMKLTGNTDIDISSSTVWVELKDCHDVLPLEYIDNLVYNTPAFEVAWCPCGKPIWNTPRYITRTRRSAPYTDTAVFSAQGYSGPRPDLPIARVAPSLNAAPDVSQMKHDLESINNMLAEHKLEHDVSSSVYRHQLAATLPATPDTSD